MCFIAFIIFISTLIIMPTAVINTMVKVIANLRMVIIILEAMAMAIINQMNK